MARKGNKTTAAIAIVCALSLLDELADDLPEIANELSEARGWTLRASEEWALKLGAPSRAARLGAAPEIAIAPAEGSSATAAAEAGKISTSKRSSAEPRSAGPRYPGERKPDRPIRSIDEAPDTRSARPDRDRAL